MNDKAYKWIIGVLLTALVAASGWAYTSANSRINRNERLLDTVIPILYRIEEKVSNIERILEKKTDLE